MITLSDVRALLERALTHAENPAIVRLTDRTVEGVARAYMGRGVWITVQGWTGCERPVKYHYWNDRPYVDAVLDLTDPGTAHALLVVLALALGLEPGVGGLGVAWFFVPATDATPWRRWCLMADRLMDFADLINRAQGSRYAPTVAAEPDPLKALALAARHVLENP